MANQLKSIKHIVQVMLENRSFDQMLGFLYTDEHNKSPNGDAYEGLTGSESNPDDTGRDVKVFKITKDSKHPYLMPGADPGEGFQNTNLQLFSEYELPAGAEATNKGFIVNFKAAIAYDQSKHYKDSLDGTVPSDIMGMYTPEMLPILSALAKGFAVCDHWFASAPTETIPNRAFAAAGTSQGHMDDNVKVFTCPSIFGALSEKGQDWAIYGYNRDPLTRLDFPDTQSASSDHFGHFRDFQDRAAAGTLPAYTFLEPDFGANGNSQHPNYDVAAGEKFLHDIYYALHDGPGWEDTLLVITYDEHGGNFDHVAPPTNAVPPDDSAGEYGFDFKRFGVRVPAVLVSPRIKRGTVFRPESGTLDHTSVLKTVGLCWDVAPLTARVAAAPDLGDVLTLATARTDDPLKGVPIPVSPDAHPAPSNPSKLERIHASRLSKLPIRNDQGTYANTTPDLSSTASVGDYIRGRSAAWSQHVDRSKKPRIAPPGGAPARHASKHSKTTR
ncbi:MAG TPA: alkaline phosphatase family protein [Polyangiaceae bacterium]|jgi:phospholipase C|nr:alkaline phosphatase family protein [Polyangiaceae bacterium]